MKENEACAYKGCQFNQLEPFPAEYQFHGKSYCIFHLPIEAKKKWNQEQIDAFQNYLAHRLATGNNHLIGVQVIGNFSHDNIHLNNALLEDCHFNGKFALIAKGSLQKLRMLQSTFEDEVNLPQWSMARGSEVRGCNFHKKFSATSPGGDSSHITFHGSKFLDEVDLSGRGFVEADFSKVVFDQVPNFSGCMFPQKTNFHGAKFKASPKDGEAMYRTLRLEMERLKARYYEGIFYGLEKRCERKKHPYGFSRSISYLYDLVSSYGHSYVKAAISFAIFQLVFFLTYALSVWGDWNHKSDIASTAVPLI